MRCTVHSSHIPHTYTVFLSRLWPVNLTACKYSFCLAERHGFRQSSCLHSDIIMMATAEIWKTGYCDCTLGMTYHYMGHWMYSMEFLPATSGIKGRRVVSRLSYVSLLMSMENVRISIHDLTLRWPVHMLYWFPLRREVDDGALWSISCPFVSFAVPEVAPANFRLATRVSADNVDANKEVKFAWKSVSRSDKVIHGEFRGYRVSS